MPNSCTMSSGFVRCYDMVMDIVLIVLIDLKENHIFVKYPHVISN